MSNLPVPMTLSESDYELIEEAVMETARGRWFLAEFAQRNRHADTTMLLSAIERLGSMIRSQADVRLQEPSPAEPVEKLRMDLVEMARSIARTKAEIASIKPDSEDHGKFGEATEELDSIVQSTEKATSEILAAAEQIQEIAWTLREQGFESRACELIDSKATTIYTACSFQDLTGQRTSKVIHALRYLEGRINAMIEIWGLEGALAAEAEQASRSAQDGAGLLGGPARHPYGLDQTDIDIVMAPAVAAVASPAMEDEEIEVEAEAHIEAETDFLPDVSRAEARLESEKPSAPEVVARAAVVDAEDTLAIEPESDIDAETGKPEIEAGADIAPWSGTVEPETKLEFEAATDPRSEPPASAEEVEDALEIGSDPDIELEAETAKPDFLAGLGSEPGLPAVEAGTKLESEARTEPPTSVEDIEADEAAPHPGFLLDDADADNADDDDDADDDDEIVVDDLIQEIEAELLEWSEPTAPSALFAADAARDVEFLELEPDAVPAVPALDTEMSSEFEEFAANGESASEGHAAGIVEPAALPEQPIDVSTRTAGVASAAIALIEALSAEEKIALFS
jgi:chemotaxis regulatin CheY-phosphate phosphatase CheZ